MLPLNQYTVQPVKAVSIAKYSWKSILCMRKTFGLLNMAILAKLVCFHWFFIRILILSNLKGNGNIANSAKVFRVVV